MCAPLSLTIFAFNNSYLTIELHIIATSKLLIVYLQRDTFRIHQHVSTKYCLHSSTMTVKGRNIDRTTFLKVRILVLS